MSAVDESIFFTKAWDRPAEFHVHEEPLDSAGVVLTVHGELDLYTADEFRERLDAAVDGGAKRLVLDLSPVAFMDSVAIATILHTRTRLGDDGRLAVVIPSGSYTRLVFEVAGLPRCLELFETLEETI
jgi:anti-sigma B factor antagonist